MKNIFVDSTEKKKQHAYTTAIYVNGYSDGVILRFPGQTTASSKRYKKLGSVGTLYSGNRVLLRKESGTYVVIGKL